MKSEGMILNANIAGAGLLAIEALLAWMAFGEYSSNGKPCPKGWDNCAIKQLYNENFTTIPGVGTISNLYPLLNVTVVPILAISLRNNFFDVFNLEVNLQKIGVPKKLLNMKSYWIKGFWSFIIQIPVIIITLFYRNPQTILLYTGGVCATFIMMIIPLILIQGVRRDEEERNEMYGPNIHKSRYSGKASFIFVWAFVCLTLISVLYQIVNSFF